MKLMKILNLKMDTRRLKSGMHFVVTDPFPHARTKSTPPSCQSNQLIALSTFDNVLVVDNVPLVNTDRRQKLLDRLRQLFAKAGAPLKGELREGEGEDRGYDDMDMPWDDENDSNKG